MDSYNKTYTEMCRNILKHTTFITVQNLALNIIDEQTENIKNMRKISSDCKKAKNPSQDVDASQIYFSCITKNMFESMKNVYITNNTNQIFVKAMLPYQESLLRISECLLLRYNICSLN